MSPSWLRVVIIGGALVVAAIVGVLSTGSADVWPVLWLVLIAVGGLVVAAVIVLLAMKLTPAAAAVALLAKKVGSSTARHIGGRRPAWRSVLTAGGALLAVAIVGLLAFNTYAILSKDESGNKHARRIEAYDREKATLAEQGERLLDSNPTGSAWAEWRKTVGIKLSQTWDVLTTQLGIEQEPRESELIEDRLAERYWNLEPDANNDGMIDDAEGLQFDTKRKAILAEATAAGVSEDYIKVQYRGRMWKNNPRLQAIEEQYQQAKDIAAEYYSIPAKRGYTSEEEAELAPWAAQAADMKSTFHYSPRRALDQLGLDADLAQRVLRYMNRAENPARARFWRENQDKHLLYKQFYREIPLETEPEEWQGPDGRCQEALADLTDALAELAVEQTDLAECQEMRSRFETGLPCLMEESRVERASREVESAGSTVRTWCE